MLAIATSAVRDAGNGDAFIAELRERFGLDAQLLTGEEEARLTYLGATAQRPLADEATLVFDIGGGSTELVVGSGTEVASTPRSRPGRSASPSATSTADPPDPHELEDLADDVGQLIEQAVASGQTATGRSRAIAVAGTPTSLAAIDQELEPYDPTRVHGHRLAMRPIQQMLSTLSRAAARRAPAGPGAAPGAGADDRRRQP